MLLEAERERLLRLARRSLEARVRSEPEPDVERGGVMDDLFGAFVTIHLRGELRGCLGRIEGDVPLGEVVRHLAQAVSDSDPRFQPVAPHELPELEIEISVLTPEREVSAVSDIEVGRHGLIVERGHRRGLLLPQVAVEHGWTREAFLEHTCLKAGLPRTAWRQGARLFMFEAEIFGERPGR